MDHTCSKQEIIENMRIDIAVSKSNISEVKTEIKDIKDSIDKLNWWIIGILGTSVISLVILIFNLIK